MLEEIEYVYAEALLRYKTDVQVQVPVKLKPINVTINHHSEEHVEITNKENLKI